MMKHCIVLQKYSKIASFLSLCLLIYSCGGDRLKVKTPELKEKVKIERFDKELFESDTNNFTPAITALYKKYPDIVRAFMFDLYPHDFRKRRDIDTAEMLELWKPNFVTNKFMKDVYSEMKKQYSTKEIGDIENQLTDIFSHLKYYFPKDTIPKFATMMTSFSYKVYITETGRYCICLDMFLGPDYKYYSASNIDIPKFISAKCSKEYIPETVVKAYFTRRFENKITTDNTLLSEVIQAGKLYYFLDAMAPDMQDSLKIEYTGAQLKWCNENTSEIWGYFTGKDIFFKTDNELKVKFLKDAPFTNATGIPQESAPRLGEWLGWQIVRKYMNSHKDVSLQQLFDEKDYRKILTLSKYHPK